LQVKNISRIIREAERFVDIAQKWRFDDAGGGIKEIRLAVVGNQKSIRAGDRLPWNHRGEEAIAGILRGRCGRGRSEGHGGRRQSGEPVQEAALQSRIGEMHECLLRLRSQSNRINLDMGRTLKQTGLCSEQKDCRYGGLQMSIKVPGDARKRL